MKLLLPVIFSLISPEIKLYMDLFISRGVCINIMVYFLNVQFSECNIGGNIFSGVTFSLKFIFIYSELKYRLIN